MSICLIYLQILDGILARISKIIGDVPEKTCKHGFGNLVPGENDAGIFGNVRERIPKQFLEDFMKKLLEKYRKASWKNL